MVGRAQVPIPMDKIEAFCQRWRIVEFALFGSVLRDDFRSDSDVDVMVTFSAHAGWDLWDMVAMRDELTALFGREADLVQKHAITNPFRRRSILANHKVIYAAG